MKSLKIIGVLTVTSLLSGWLLSYTYKNLSKPIEENLKQEIRKNIFSLVEGAFTIEEYKKDTLSLYKVLDRDDYLLAYCLVGEGNGYQAEIKILVAVKPDLETLWGIEIIESSETPGLGARINSQEFKSSFQGLIAIPKVILVKRAPQRHNEVEAISGATISSRAVIKIINETLEVLRRMLKKD